MYMKQVVFAGGCFWGLEALLRAVPGVVDTEVGYCGGENDYPTYEHHPGHAEAVSVLYDPTHVPYRALVDYFFRIHNPTTLNQQGNDRGTSYRSAIFYATPEELAITRELIALVNASGRWTNPVVTTLEPLTHFWPAEAYHQDYLEKHPGGYTCHTLYCDSYLPATK